MGLRVYEVGFEVWGFGFSAYSRRRASSLGPAVRARGLVRRRFIMVYELRFAVKGLGFGVYARRRAISLGPRIRA